MMRTLLPVLAVAGTFMAVVGCAPTPRDANAADRRTVEVSVTYLQRIALTPGHVMTVRLEDVSLADAPARAVAEMTQGVGGRAPPYDVVFTLPASAVDPRHTYGVRAEIRDEGGRLRFTTTTAHHVMTRGAPDRAEIVLQATR